MLKIVISTPDNPERAENVRRQMESQNITDYLLLPAVMMPKHVPMGICRSFKKAIHIAWQNNLSRVLIFEDDVNFLTPNAYHEFIMAKTSLMEEFDVILGGIYDGNPVPVNERVARVEGKLSGLHCALFNKSCYEKILSCDENANLDYTISEVLKLKTFCMYPMGITQRDGYSYNVKQETNYNQHLGQRYKLLGQ